MDPQQGGVNTCFLTTRLPTWAGSRQNVVGSDLEGHPVQPGPDFLDTDQRLRGLLTEIRNVNAALDDLKNQVGVIARQLQAAPPAPQNVD